MSRGVYLLVYSFHAPMTFFPSVLGAVHVIGALSRQPSECFGGALREASVLGYMVEPEAKVFTRLCGPRGGGLLLNGVCKDVDKNIGRKRLRWHRVGGGHGAGRGVCPLLRSYNSQFAFGGAGK